MTLDVELHSVNANNASPFAGLKVYLLYRPFLPSRLMFFVWILSFDFQCLPYVTLKIMCDCAGNDNTELSNVLYSEWCGTDRKSVV